LSFTATNEREQQPSEHYWPPVPPSLPEVYQSVREPDPIDELYVLEQLDEFSATALRFMHAVRVELALVHNLIALADAIDDAKRAVDAAWERAKAL